MREDRSAYSFVCRVMNDMFNSKKGVEMGLTCGEANGYAAVPWGHPLYGVSCFDIEWELDGKMPFDITFAGSYGELIDQLCAIIPTDDERELPVDIRYWWVFGFDTMHDGYDRVSWPISRVGEEADNLKAWLDEYARG